MNTSSKVKVDVVLRVAVAALALANGYIHSTLGGLQFTLNAIGFVVLAIALIAPVWPFGQVRWLTRLAVIGFAGTTAIGWYLFGARYNVGYLSVAIDLTIVALAAIDSYVAVGSPVQIARRIVRLGGRFVPGLAGA